MSNSVINTFYMQFRSDSKQARDDMDTIEKKIDVLRAKGKKRSDEENAEMKTALKQRKELNDSIKETQNNTEKLIESATQAVAAYISFQAIKAGILDAQKMNRELTIQTDLWKQNANTVSAYGAAIKANGGSSQALYSWYQGIRNENIAKGQPTQDIDKLNDQIHRQIMQNPGQAQFILGQYHVSDPGQQTMLQKSDADYQKDVQHAREITAQTAAGAEASQKFGTAVDNLDTAMTNLWTVIDGEVLPPLTDMINALTDFATKLSANKDGVIAFFAAIVAAATFLGASSLKTILSLTGLRGGLLSLLDPLTAVTGVILRFVGVLAGLGLLAYEDGAAVNDLVTGKRESWIGRNSRHFAGKVFGIDMDGSGVKGGASGDSGSAMQYLMKTYGLDADHAAGIVANMNAESGGDPNVKDGDNGQARGAFQWHPDRQKAIQDHFGIDVKKMTRNQSLDAMVWEAKQRGQWNPFLAQNGAANAGAYLSTNYEVAHGLNGPVAEAMKRGQASLALTNSSPFSSGNGTSSTSNSSVHVDNITINTQSNDPKEIARIARQEFGGLVKQAHAQHNDSVGA